MEIELYVFDLTVPGTWLDYQDREWTRKIEGMIRNLQSQFFEANLALNLFVEESAKRPVSETKEQWEKDSQSHSEIRKKIEEKYGGSFNNSNLEVVSFETEVEFKQVKWKQGRLPREFEHNRVFIFAKAFLYALDSFEKFLDVLSVEEDVPESLQQLHQKFKDIFPDLRGVRNTSHHIEDRIRGLGVGGKELDLKPIENSFIYAPGGGVLAINNLNGTKYGSTMSNGHYGEVDISPDSMEKLQEIIQEVLMSFKWKGPLRHKPD